jgi:hypothetical protein
MPLKLPAPDFGTAEQAGPKSFDVVDADDVGVAEAEDDALGAVVDEDEVVLHAATPKARIAAAPGTARARYFMVFLLFLQAVPSGDGHHD